jgi:hypothetical protein
MDSVDEFHQRAGRHGKCKVHADDGEIAKFGAEVKDVGAERAPV